MINKDEMDYGENRLMVSNVQDVIIQGDMPVFASRYLIKHVRRLPGSDETEVTERKVDDYVSNQTLHYKPDFDLFE